MLQTNSILVTGGAGFIGSCFVRYILASQPMLKIVNLDALTYAGSLDNLIDLPNEEQYHFIKGNICDRKLIDRVLREHQINAIVHFAAESHVDRSISGPAAFIETNIVGTFNLLEAARSYWLDEMELNQDSCRFHHISTDEVYGSLELKDPSFTELTAYAPNSPYSATKAGSDHLVRAYYHTYGLPVTTSNCSNNYGPFQHLEKLIPTVINACVTQSPIPVYGDGQNIRDWLYVEDHCRAIELILKKGKLGETYNVGGGAELTNLVLIQLICDLMDEYRPQSNRHADLITFVTDRPGHDLRYSISNEKIANDLGWQPREAIETGLRKTLEFYLGRIG